jgi:hypothetical protein
MGKYMLKAMVVADLFDQGALQQIHGFSLLANGIQTLRYPSSSHRVFQYARHPQPHLNCVGDAAQTCLCLDPTHRAEHLASGLRFS